MAKDLTEINRSNGSHPHSTDDPWSEYRLAKAPEKQQAPGDSKPGTTSHETIVEGSQERDYFVHTPKNYDPSKPTDVVMVFNGYGNGKAQGDAAAGGAGMEDITGFSKKADEKNFIVVYMDGNPKDKHSWNNGQWWFSKEDDLKFTGDVLDRVGSRFNVDQNKVFLAGFSQGGSFVHKLASDMPGRFAAIATVSSWMTGCEHPTDISSMHIHSRDDTTVPVTGRNWWLTMQPVERLKNYYRQQGDPHPRNIAFASERGMIEVEQSVNPHTRKESFFLTVESEGHKWMGGKGSESSPVNATNEIWDFFQRHSASEGSK